MIYQRLPYDEAATPAQMASDCQAVTMALQLPPAAPRAQQQAPEVPVLVSDAAATLAGTFVE